MPVYRNDIEQGRSPASQTNDPSRRTGHWPSFRRLSPSSRRVDVETERRGHIVDTGEPTTAVPRTQPAFQSPEKSDEGNYTHTENENACAKLWSAYVGEAERYDKRLVESWKGDMNGMLIFSGLFSAILTAFIVESYTTLQPDPRETVAALLFRISQQLDVMANGSMLIADDPAPFQYTTAALLCNALWFSSLALSLTCALMATLVDQWARDFLHRTEIHPAPVLRARVLSFLYLGLKQFHMHTFVESIPVFLHLSLFLFFGGLVAFLLPINLALTYLVGIIFIVFFCFYVFLTGLPVICRACPYRTPLSGGLWRLKHYFDVYIGSKNDDRSMMEAMSEDALKKSADRDRHAVRWTLASLTDDEELLPFVEAIPDVIHGPKGFHSVNDHLFLPILDSKEPQLSLSSRIVGLLRSSVNLPLDDTSRIRCQASCLKAIWALGMSNAKSDRPSTHFAINTLDVLALKSLNPRYVLSACASVRYSRWNAYKSRIDGVREALVRFDTGVPQRHTVQTIKSMRDGLEEIGIPESASFISRGDFESFRRHFRTLKSTTLSALEGTREGSIIVSAPLSDLKEAAQHLSAHNHWVVARIVILADFLLESLKTGIIPYELLTTCQEILPNLSGVVPVEIRSLEALFTSFPDPSAVASMTSDLHDVDKMVNISLRLLPFVPESPIRYTSLSALYRYIANRNSDKAVLYILRPCSGTSLRAILAKFWLVKFTNCHGQNHAISEISGTPFLGPRRCLLTRARCLPPSRPQTCKIFCDSLDYVDMM